MEVSYLQPENITIEDQVEVGVAVRMAVMDLLSRNVSKQIANKDAP